MDKFGIFKLLNSFLDNYKTPLTKDSPLGDQNSKTDSLLDGLKSLIPEKQATPKPSQPPYPLQKNMISTMQNHDEFVKRVREKNT